MSKNLKRLQVLVETTEYARLNRHARSQGLTLGAWVRTSLRRITDAESSRSVEARLQAIARGYQYAAPAADPEDMKREILQGYLGDDLR